MLQVDNDPIVLGAGNPSTSQIAAATLDPSGAYLSSVSTDSSLTGNGTIVSPLSAAPLTGVATPVSETKASLTIQTALKLEAKPLGILGNYITVRAVSSGVAGMSISDLTGAGTQADPYLIEIKLGTTVTNNTMTLIAAAISAKTDVAAIVNAIVITGATQMTVFSVVSLSGGVNGTVGYDLQVVKDTNGVKWELKRIISNCYYWCPDGFPTVNIAYYSHYDKTLGDVYKIRVSQTSGGAGVNSLFPIPNTTLTSKGLCVCGILTASAIADYPLPTFFGSTLVTISSRWASENSVLNFRLTVTTDFASKPFIADCQFIY